VATAEGVRSYEIGSVLGLAVTTLCYWLEKDLELENRLENGKRVAYGSALVFRGICKRPSCDGSG
jgi:hypothetical protein